MDTNTQSYFAEQLALFNGGYEGISATFRMHVVGTEPVAVVNLALWDTATHEPIAIQVPVIRCTLGDAEELAHELAVAIRQVYALVSPF